MRGSPAAGSSMVAEPVAVALAHACGSRSNNCCSEVASCSGSKRVRSTIASLASCSQACCKAAAPEPRRTAKARVRASPDSTTTRAAATCCWPSCTTSVLRCRPSAATVSDAASWNPPTVMPSARSAPSRGASAATGNAGGTATCTAASRSTFASARRPRNSARARVRAMAGEAVFAVPSKDQ